MNITLDKNFKKRAKGRFEKYDFEVGILENKPHKLPMVKNGFNQFGYYAGGPVRRAGKKGPNSLNDISQFIREDMRTNYLQEPFKGGGANKDVMRFAEGYFRLVQGKVSVNQVQNLLQAIVRNPFLRGDYGSNSRTTIAEKGFDRFGIDTGQFFKAIKATAKKVRFWKWK